MAGLARYTRIINIILYTTKVGCPKYSTGKMKKEFFDE